MTTIEQEHPSAIVDPATAGDQGALRELHRRPWVAPTTGDYRDNLTPATGEPFTQVADSGADDIELALDAAHAAKDAWGEASTTERAAVLNAFADAIEENLETLAIAESLDNGKPIRETLAADIPLAVDHFRYFASRDPRRGGQDLRDRQGHVAYHFHEPLGVVGQIIPFNFPLLMAAWKIAPALAAGNCTVLKPASPTPWSILKLMELHRRHRPARRDQHRQRPRRRDRPGAGLEQADRQDRLHRRDRHRAADHAVRGPEHHPLDHRARRQVAEHLLRRRDGRGTTSSSTRRSRDSSSTPSTRARSAPALRGR